jgi:DNA integrity scanning protein DisA with diadenylate cyclase activity
MQMAVGIASIVGLFYLSRGLQLETLNWLIRNIIGYVVFAAIVLLQADIRRALVHLAAASCSAASIARWPTMTRSRNWWWRPRRCRRSGSARSW